MYLIWTYHVVYTLEVLGDNVVPVSSGCPRCPVFLLSVSSTKLRGLALLFFVRMILKVLKAINNMFLVIIIVLEFYDSISWTPRCNVNWDQDLLSSIMPRQHVDLSQSKDWSTVSWWPQHVLPCPTAKSQVRQGGLTIRFQTWAFAGEVLQCSVIAAIWF